MSILQGLAPQRVFYYFEQMAAIPHGSRNTAALSAYCIELAEKFGLHHRQDEAGNVIIWKDGTAGYEQAPPVILQGHLDMVCEVAPDCSKDMQTEGLDLFIDGDLIGARGTTLGADDGIAVAMALALLEAKDIAHPPLEVVLTTDEEIGMLGAMALDAADLRGKRLLNIDSEDEGILTVSCAGGNVTECKLPIRRQDFDGMRLSIQIGGLTGGHSGIEIDKGRANANLLLGRLLYRIAQQTEMRLLRIDGGRKDNAIPSEAIAEIAVSDEGKARETAAEFEKLLQNEQRTADPQLFLQVQPTDGALCPMDKNSTARVLCLLQNAPNGVQAMSRDIEGLVQTSLNLGILQTSETEVCAAFCVRSSLASQKQMLVDRLECLMTTLGGQIELSGDYPAWEYRRDSQLRRKMVEVFRQEYGKEPKIEAIHAGLECGLLAGKIKGLDCISFGPNLTGVHTPRERMEVGSVQRCWDYLLAVLAQLKE